MFMADAEPISAALDAVPADPSAADRLAAARARVETQMAMLTELAGIGMEIARAAGRRATASLEDEALDGARPDPVLAYARAARAVRMTIALQARLAKDLLALDRAEASDRAAQATARRGRVHRLVERAIRDAHDDQDEIENLSDDALERLQDREAFGDLDGRPLGEVVALICKDLGLSPDWSAWAGEVGAGEIGAGPSIKPQGFPAHRPPSGSVVEHPRPATGSGGGGL